MPKDNSSGRIWIESEVLKYECVGSGWQVRISDIKVIGEHTDDHGPYVDDYFFVFLTQRQTYEASFYAEGRDEVLTELSRALGRQLSCELVRITEFQSRVMWPADLEGQPLFDFVPKPRSGRVWARFKNALLPQVEYHLVEAVKRKLRVDSERRI